MILFDPGGASMDQPPQKPISALLVEDNDGDAGLVRACLSENPAAQVKLTHVYRLGDAIMRLRGESFDVVLLDLSLPDSQGLSTVTRLNQNVRGVPVIVLTGLDDEGAAIRAVENGAQDYLVKGDYDGARLLRTMRYSIARLASSARVQEHVPLRTGKAIGFLGGKAGTGVSTLLCNTAARIREITNGRVLTVDCNFSCGMIGFFLRAKSPYSVADVAANITRLDANLWEAFVSKTADGLDALPAPPAYARVERPGAEALRSVLDTARMYYEWTLVDLGAGFAPFQGELLPNLDQVVLVSQPDILALYRTKLVLEALRQQRYLLPSVHLALNRMPKKSDMSLEDVQAVLGMEVFAELAESPSETGNFYLQGEFVDSKSSLGKQVTRFAEELTRTDPVPTGTNSRFAISY